MVDFTVAIRTYNGAKRLPAVLEQLRWQVDTEQISWEVVIVDNNSTDKTAAIIQQYQVNWPQRYPLHYYFEPRQGAAIARRRAVKESQGELIGFIDDDNLPSASWVAAAYAFGKAYPKAGAYGGQIHGEFEVEPPKNFKKIAPFLALVERGPQPFCYNTYNKVLPPGAGLVVRKQVWLDRVPERFFLQGPVAGTLGSKGEDLEALSYIQNAGWEIWYNPEMHIRHTIPNWRLERDYLISLVRSVGLARHKIRMIRLQAWKRPLAFSLYLTNDLRKAILHLVKHKKILKTDTVAACEMELLLSGIVSPFYLWRQSLRKLNQVKS